MKKCCQNTHTHTHTHTHTYIYIYIYIYIYNPLYTFIWKWKIFFYLHKWLCADTEIYIGWSRCNSAVNDIVFWFTALSFLYKTVCILSFLLTFWMSFVDNRGCFSLNCICANSAAKTVRVFTPSGTISAGYTDTEENQSKRIYHPQCLPNALLFLLKPFRRKFPPCCSKRAQLQPQSKRVRTPLALSRSLSQSHPKERYEHTYLPTIGQIVPSFFFYKKDFGIKEPMKVYMPLN